MKLYTYRLLDVFTDRPFGGKALAVFTDAGGLSDEQMQRFARELNLSETTFVLPALSATHQARVRIFTPLAELPTAGHPTIGTAFALQLEERIRREAEKQRVVFEEEDGPVSVTMESPMITMHQPLPEFAPPFHDVDAVAAILGLDSASLDRALPVQSVSCGIPYLMVPVADLSAMQRIRFRTDIWERVLRRSPHPHVLPFTMQTVDPNATVHARMFAPALGIPEDAATGSAAGPLGCYLVTHGVLRERPELWITSEQGIEMGRPSRIHIGIERSGGQVSKVRVGGQCVAVGEGRFALEG